MDRTRWIIFIAICFITLGGLVIFSKKDAPKVAELDPAQVLDVKDGSIGDHVAGKKDSKIVVIEYADYQCPGCGGAYPQIKAVQQKYSDKVAFVFRNFPLTTIHPNALAAATAAEAAGLQGKFWEMHDKLYENQQNWSNVDAAKRTDVFTIYAGEIGIDTNKFKTDLSDNRITEKINRDRALASRLKVDSTPTIYIGTEKMSAEVVSDLGNSNGSKMMSAIDEALRQR